MSNTHRYQKRRRQLSVETLEDRLLFALDPTPIEQESMQLINRFRTDPRGEFSRLIASVSPRRAFDANVDFSLSFFNTNVGIVQGQLAALSPVPPIAWDEIAQRVALEYLPYMAAAKSSAHNLNGTFQQRIQRYPFDFSLGGTAKENTFANAFSPIHTHAAYVIDWGNGPNGLQAPGHRDNLMNPAVKSGGTAFMAVTYEPTTGFGPNLNAQDLIGLGVTPPMVTGAVFQDRNGSGWYDAGEGLAGVQLVFQGATSQYTVNAMSAGGYNAVVPAGTYTVTASGGGMRFPISITNVTVGTQNVWLNFIYDPNHVPADAFESNNSLGTATLLAGNDQTLSGGTISLGDVDYFRLPASTTGVLTATLQFPAGNGNLDLRLLNSSGATVTQANSSTSLETLSSHIIAGQIYYLVVESVGVGGPYSLQVDVPPAQAAEGRADQATTSLNEGPIIIKVLANDRDPDGDLARAQLSISQIGRGTVDVIMDGQQPALRYQPEVGFVGIDRLAYAITDQQGLASEKVLVEVMVLDLSAPLPFHNANSRLDVNGDGFQTAIDALIVINRINQKMTGPLPTNISAARPFFGYVDVNGSGTLEPLDVLLVVNGLNAARAGAGENSASGSSLAPDWTEFKRLSKSWYPEP